MPDPSAPITPQEAEREACQGPQIQHRRDLAVQRLFPDDTDPLLCYKADAEQREQEAAAKREREARDGRRVESRQVTLLRAEVENLRGEIAALHAEMNRRSDMHLEPRRRADVVPV